MKLKRCYLIFVSVIGINSAAYGSQILFDSGIGTGPYDHMTYLYYYSEIIFTPFNDMIVSEIEPYIFFCNGECSYGLKIVDSKGTLVAETYTESMYFDQLSLNDTMLMANHDYRIYELAKSSKSIGIWTAGSDSPNIKPNGKYELMSAYTRSNISTFLHYDHYDRGPIAFRLYGELTPVPLPSTIILLGSCLAGLLGLKRKYLR